MATWPSTLPDCISLAGYSERRVNGTLRTEMDAGPAFVRRRFSAVPTIFSASIVMTKDELDIFDTFYFTTTAQGAIPFDWQHPRTQDNVSMRFLEPPGYQPITSEYWTVTFSAEILP